MSQQTKKIDSILSNDESIFGQLMNKAKALSKLDDTIQNILDANLKGRYKIAGYEKGVLTFLTDNGATATQLRYQTPEMLRSLRSQPQWAGLVTISVKVHHHWHEYIAPTPKEPVGEPVKISEQSKETLRMLIESLKEEPGNEAIIKSLYKLIASN